MGRAMSFDFGLEKASTCWKTRNRWLMKIPNVSADGVDSLPPLKSARPSLSFKTIEIQHLNETVYRPSKADWKPVSLVLYDLKRNEHPVFKWIKKLYDPQDGSWKRPGDYIVSQVRLELYDGCGNTLETWVFENVWIEEAQFNDLDMAAGEFVQCDITLRYDRAYIE